MLRVTGGAAASTVLTRRTLRVASRFKHRHFPDFRVPKSLNFANLKAQHFFFFKAGAYIPETLFSLHGASADFGYTGASKIGKPRS